MTHIGNALNQEQDRLKLGDRNERRGGGLPQFTPKPEQLNNNAVRIPSGMLVPYELIRRLKDRRSQDHPDGKGGRFVSVYEDFAGAGLDHSEKCGNCGGKNGSGMIYAPTGEKVPARYFGHSETVQRKNIEGEVYYSEEPVALRRAMEGFPCPVCSGTARKQFMRERSGLLVGTRTWGDIDHRIYPIPGREEFEKSVNAAVAQWTNGNPTGWLTLIGGYGIGKSAVGEAIVKRCVDSGVEAAFVEASTLFQVANDSFGDFDTDPQTVLRFWREIPVLVVDELDWKNTRKFNGDMSRAAEEVITMLQHRYRTQKSTAIISPLDWWVLDMDGVLHLDQNQGSDWKAVLSRASEGWIAYTTIPDQRQQFGKARRGE